jgi:hypothetical protein
MKIKVISYNYIKIKPTLRISKYCLYLDWLNFSMWIDK